LLQVEELEAGEVKSRRVPISLGQTVSGDAHHVIVFPLQIRRKSIMSNANIFISSAKQLKLCPPDLMASIRKDVAEDMGLWVRPASAKANSKAPKVRTCKLSLFWKRFRHSLFAQQMNGIALFFKAVC
jgi:hypothetical protein